MSAPSVDIRSIFSRALEIGALGERAAYLKEACGGDAALIAEIEELLAAAEKAGSFMHGPATSAYPTSAMDGVAESPGMVIGPYKLLQKVGEGGMGVVFMAEQTRPVTRMVALKIIKPGMDSRQVIARFEAERQALALMDHPNIARVLDAGATESGRPYFVMELVKGVAVTQYADEHQLTPRERLELFLPVCKAVQHAHQKGVVHRDIKPTNVLVAEYDNHAVPKVIDFGVAKATSQRLTERTMFTEFGQLVGTLEYMSPEQAKLNQLDIDTRTDIYSLGVLLYELLTGETPFDRQRLRSAAFDEVLRIIREEDPPRPSTRLSSSDALPSIAACRHLDPQKLKKIVRGELDWVVMKALEKDRNRRYETASGLASDLERYLSNEPVHAGPPSASYRLRKLASRHRGPLAVGTAFVLLLAVASVVSTWQAVRAIRAERQVSRERDQVIAEKQRSDELRIAADQARQLEQEQRTLAEARRREAEAERAKAEKQRAIAVEQRMLAEQQRELADEQRAVAEERRSEAIKMERIAAERLAMGLVAAGDAALALGRAEARDNYREAQALQRRLTLSEVPATTGLLASYADQPAPLLGADARTGGVGGFEGHQRGRLYMAFSPDGRCAASASTSGGLMLWDVTTGRLVRTLSAGGPDYYDVKFTPDGRSLLTASSSGDLALWDVATGLQTRRWAGHRGQVRAVAFSPDGKLAASGGYDSKVRLWNVATWDEVRAFEMPSFIESVAFSPDGRRLISGGEPSDVRLWEVESGKLIHAMTTPDGAAPVGLAFSPDGRTAAAGYLNHLILLWDLETGEIRKSLDGHRAAVVDIAFSPDGRRVVSASYDKTLRLWEAATGAQLRVWRGHERALHSAVFSADGRFILSADEGGSIKLWPQELESDIASCRGHTSRVISVIASADGRTALSGSFDGSIRLWDVATCLPLRTIKAGDSPVWDVAQTRDLQTFVSAHEDGTLSVWDARTGERRRQLTGHTDLVTAVALSPDETKALSTSSDGTLRLWDLATGKTLRTFQGHADRVRNVAFAPDGRTALSASFDQTLKLWDVDSGSVLRTFQGHRHWIIGLDLAPDGRTAASGGWDRTWGLWDVDTGKSIFFAEGAADVVSAVAFSPGGKLLLTGCLDGHVGLWSVAERRHVRDFSVHSDGVTSLAYCPDGQTALSGGRDGLILRWQWNRPAQYENFKWSLPKARDALAADPNNGTALAKFGRWYAFRGVNDWAAEFLEKAQKAGADVSHLELARCYWQLGRREDAAREFRHAVKRGEAPKDYLELCLQAVSDVSADPADQHDREDLPDFED